MATVVEKEDPITAATPTSTVQIPTENASAVHASAVHERYRQLDAFDRSTAEQLNRFCRTNSRQGTYATRLANVAVFQAVLTSLPLALADLVSLYISLLGATLVASWLLATAITLEELKSAMLISLVLIPLANLAGLYPGLGQGPIIEFRQIARALFASAWVYACMGMFCFPAHWHLFAVAAILAFPISLPIAGTCRYLMRQVVKHFRFWGAPILIVAEPHRGLELYRRIAQHLEHGFKPVGVLLDYSQYQAGTELLEVHGVPTFDMRDASEVAIRHRVAWVLVSACANRSVTPAHDPSLAAIPNRIQLTSSQFDFGMWDQLLCVGSTYGLRVGSACPNTVQLGLKRLLDLGLTSAALVVGSPILLTICMLVRMSSRGPIFYSQRRIGLGGREFRAWKFRSMQMNADRVLEQYLATHPEAQTEWEEKHKLTHDPRVTRIGKFLRATSLDEIPQLWNVILGEMSLVGPRPIVDSPTYDAAYIHQYPDEYETYKTVRPGLTGLWQVRCRNSGVYELRIYWDMYYIRNWCVWLDLYLIMRTIKTVLFREGAY